MMPLPFLLLLGTLLCLAFGWLGGYIAEQKGREFTEGCLLGFLLGPLGVLIAALMPTLKPARPRREGARRDHGGWQPPKEDDPAEDLAIACLSDPRRIGKNGTLDPDATRSRS